MKLFILMLAPFAFGTGAYLVSGLLEPMATELGVSVASVGQLQSIFALTCALAGPILAPMFSGMSRKPLLVSILLLLATANALTALGTSFTTLMVLRVIAGAVGALTLPIASTLAVLLVSDQERPKALAAVFAGNSLAFMIGVPIGGLVGSTFGWQAGFWLAAAFCVVVALLVQIAIPKPVPFIAAPAANSLSMTRPPFPGLFGVTFLSFAASFATVGYIAQLSLGAAGLGALGTGAMQALIGVGSLVGLLLGARLAQKYGTAILPVLLIAIALTQLAMFGLFHTGFAQIVQVAFLSLVILLGSASLFAIAPIVQTRLAMESGASVTIAMAINGSMLFLGQAGGIALGGLAISYFGADMIGVVGCGVAVVTALFAKQIQPAQSPQQPV